MIDPTAVLLGLRLLAGTHASGQDGIPVDIAEIRRRIDTVVERHFREVPETSRRVYGDRLAASFAAARNGTQARVLLDRLDEAALFHRVRVVDPQLMPLPTPDPARLTFPAVELPPELLKEGFDIQVEYFAARIERALEREDTPEARRLLTGQITSLCERVESRLQEILPGPAGNGFARRKVEEVRTTWIASLDLPFHAFLDRPLLPAQKDAVLRKIDEAGAGPPLIVSDGDLADAQSSLRAQAEARMEEVLEAAALATALCYASLSVHEERTRTWTLAARNWIAGKIEGAVADATELWKAARPNESPRKKRNAESDPITESRPERTSSATASRSVSSPAKPSVPPTRSSPLLWVLAATVLLLGIAALRNRFSREKG